jgi:ribosomal protein L37AE/L43A
MNSLSLSLLPPTAALLDDQPDVLRPGECPMCHTTSLTQSARDTGGAWQCVRCGQHWNAERLAAVAGYAVWVAEHDRADGRSFERSQKVVQYRDPSTELADSTP